MRPAGVAQSEARLLASGALLQQAAQGAGLLALLTIVTILARRLDSVSALAAYGLIASLAGYLLVLRNSVAASAVRAMAGAVDRDERAQVFCAAAALNMRPRSARSSALAMARTAELATLLRSTSR